jgi:hypothetical protein
MACNTPVLNGVVTATAKIDIVKDGKKYPLKAALMIKRPDSLRLESLPLFGPPDFFLAMNKGDLQIFMPGRSCFCTGRATPENIGKYLYVTIGGAELVSLLLGRPAIDAAEAGLTGRQEERLYRIDRNRADNERLSIWLDPSINRIVRLSLAMGGKRVYDAAFEKHLTAKGLVMPQQITLAGRPGTELTIRYSDIRQSADAEASFDLPVPEGLTPTPLENQR